jgi:monovalent cation/hydrogen antiporter
LALSLIRRNVVDTVTDSALSLMAPFVAFIVAEALGASGVVAVVVTGLVSAHRAPLDEDPLARLVESATWATVQFVLEGVVFALVGLQLRTILTSLDSTPAELVASSAVVLGLTIAVRPAWIFATTWLRWLARRRVDDPPRWRVLAVVSWAGMRCVVSLAAALALPNHIPRRDLLVMLTFVVIVGTLVLQGLSLPSVIRRLGIEPPDPRLDALREAGAVEEATNAALARLHTLKEADPPPAAVVQRLERLAELKVFIAWERLGASANGEPPTVAYGRLRREMLTAERRAFVERRDRGELDDDILRQVERDLDLEEALLDSIERDRRPESSMLEELIPATVELRAPSTGAGPTSTHRRRLPGMPRPGVGMGAPAPVPRLRPHRLLRFVARPPCRRPLPPDRPPGDAVGRARRGVALVLRRPHRRLR